MKILILNSGSSSLKFQLVLINKKHITLAKGHIDGIGTDHTKFIYSSKNKNIGTKIKISTHEEALKHGIKTLITTKVIEKENEIDAIGHRVVHGGEKYIKSIKINANVIKTIEELKSLAPLHNPHNLKGVLACKKLLKNKPQVAVFDTAFHHTIPPKAYLYGLPLQWYEKHGVRRYGFHGINHQYIAEKTQELLKKKTLKTISCHLGNGSSITAIKNGQSIDTSMGFTPLEGIIMGTRCGSIDPGIIFHMQKKLKLDSEEINEILNKKSGLKGLSEISSDMRHIYEESLKKNEKAQLTIDILAYQCAKIIGSYTASLNGLDALVFTGGLGEKAFYVREKTCANLEFLGIKIDKKKNKNCEILISEPKSKIKVFVIPANEELIIAKETKKILTSNQI